MKKYLLVVFLLFFGQCFHSKQKKYEIILDSKTNICELFSYNLLDDNTKKNIKKIEFTNNHNLINNNNTSLCKDGSYLVYYYIICDSLYIHVENDYKISFSYFPTILGYDSLNCLEFNNLITTDNMSNLDYIINNTKCPLEKLDLSCFNFLNLEYISDFISLNNLKTLYFPIVNLENTQFVNPLLLTGCPKLKNVIFQPKSYIDSKYFNYDLIHFGKKLKKKKLYFHTFDTITIKKSTTYTK